MTGGMNDNDVDDLARVLTEHHWITAHSRCACGWTADGQPWREVREYVARHQAAAVLAPGVVVLARDVNVVASALRDYSKVASSPSASTAYRVSSERVNALLREPATDAAPSVLEEVAAERRRQDEKWGEQNHPDVDQVLMTRAGGCSPQRMAEHYEIPTAARAKWMTDTRAARGQVTFADILLEEFAEALEAATLADATLRAELVQVAAVATQWVEAIDRRTTAAAVKGTSKLGTNSDATDAAPHGDTQGKHQVKTFQRPAEPGWGWHCLTCGAGRVNARMTSDAAKRDGEAHVWAVSLPEGGEQRG